MPRLTASPEPLGATMTKIVIIFFFIQTSILFGQKLTTEDSISITTTWEKLIKNFTDKKTEEIKKICLSKIDCLFCFTDKQLDSLKTQDYKVSADMFISKFYELIPSSKIWTVMKSERPDILIHHTGLFEVSTYTYKRNELGKGHEGAQHIFQFKKVGDSFLLYGFTSVP